ncbi:hypothetical protein RQP46_009154 [Phenoliferia psychrophenolica]
MSSRSSGISGLGITFLPSPPRPSSAERSRANVNSYARDDGPKEHSREAARTVRHSVSYDVGLNRRGWDNQHQQAEDSMGWNDQEHRRVRIAGGQPEVFGAKQPPGSRMHHPILSPLSDFDSSSSSDSQAFSPTSMSSLPSEVDDEVASPFSFKQARLAKSSGAMPFRVPAPSAAPAMESGQSRTYPPPIDDLVPTSHRPYLRPHPNSEADDDVQALPIPIPTSASRLPAFIRERTRTRDLARPKSMMELGSLYSRPLTDQRSHDVAHAHHFGGAQMLPSLSAQSGDQADDEDLGDYGDMSPESVPSSAGGLQRRHFERRLVQEQQLERERSRLELEQFQQQGQLPASHERVQMRSKASMVGLRQAETGGTFVQLDRLSRTFSEGAPAGNEREEAVIAAEDSHRDAGLSRSSTLLTAGANPVRRSKELDRLLSPSKKSMNALSPVAGSPSISASESGVTASSHARTASQSSSRLGLAVSPGAPVVLEQAKSTSKARVELDLVLETALVVEGGSLRGRIDVRVRKPKDRESEVWLGAPKVRVVGFEELAAHDARHIFYHHASSVSSMDGSTAASLPCVESERDDEGFQKGVIGQHVVPFSLRLPVGKGAKGGWKGKQGVVRYIVIASIKLKSASGGDRSIAHFYRHVEIFPYLNPAVILAPALKPLEASESKSLFMGGNGKVRVSARMHRSAWVAGQRCYVDVRVENESSKKIKTLTLTLSRTTTVFRPRPWLNAGDGHDPSHPYDVDVDADACQTQTTRKKVAETILEMGKKVNKGVTAKGSWMGVAGGENADISHFLQIPPDALTILRGRYIEITYSLKVAVSGSLSADVSADIPVRVVNFVSLDPPPGHVGTPAPVADQPRSLAKSWSVDQLGATHTPLDALRKESSSMARMGSIDSLHLADLNESRGPARIRSHALSRIPSLDSVATEDLQRDDSAPGSVAHVPIGSSSSSEINRQHQATMIIGRAKDRRLNHQMSLDCISTAIASATARRGGSGSDHQRSESALRTEIQSDWDEGEPLPQPYGGSLFYDDAGETQYESLPYGNDSGSPRLELDDLDDVPDDESYHRRQPSRHTQVDIAGESEDELDAVLGHSPHLADSDDESSSFAGQSQRSTTPTATRAQTPVPRTRPTSPVKAALEQPAPKSAMKRSEPFVFATASSPLKVTADSSKATPPQTSPIRRSQPPPDIPPRSAARGPLPPPPSFSAAPITRVASGSPVKVSSSNSSEAIGSTASSRAKASASSLSRQSSTSSLKRATVVTKRASMRSLRPATTSPETSDHSEAPELDTSSDKSSPEFESALTPPMETQARAQPRKVVARSPNLTTSRSMGDLRGSRIIRSNASVVLPSVRSKIEALETRQTALARLANSGSSSRLSLAAARPSSQGLSRANSTAESEISFDLGRANSVASFQAPLLRKVHREV